MWCQVLQIEHGGAKRISSGFSWSMSRKKSSTTASLLKSQPSFNPYCQTSTCGYRRHSRPVSPDVDFPDHLSKLLRIFDLGEPHFQTGVDVIELAVTRHVGLIGSILAVSLCEQVEDVSDVGLVAVIVARRFFIRLGLIFVALRDL